MALYTRQPFGELGTPRLQALQSTKNRQNAAAAASSNDFSSPLKPHPTPSKGKRRASFVFDDNYDSENVDPSFSNSPTKKSKHSSSSSSNDAGWIKPAKFNLVSTPSATNSTSRTPLTASPAMPSVRKALSSTSTSSTPISHSRGSPKHKRVNLLAKRRTSTSPFRRVDPPSFSTQSTPGSGLPFSIDAALSGTIPNYTPKASATPVVTQQRDAIDDSMPKGWFFEIHEDTPEQEAANLMEHSASILDISSDDDFETKQLNEDRGKENVPPPDWILAQASSSSADVDSMERAVEHVKLPRLRKIAQDAMDEDRKPLGDLPAAEFYGEGCDAKTYVTVDPGLERPSRLSKELDISSSISSENQTSTDEKEVKAEAEVAVQAEVDNLKTEEEKALEQPIHIFSDDEASLPVVTPAKEEAAPNSPTTTTETQISADCSEAL